MGKARRPTMNDIARLAGVSQATVSFVFNRKMDTGVKISDATRDRVLAAAEQLDYRRNDAAKALVTGRFSSIQVFISDITDPFFDEFIHGIEVEAQLAKYHVYLRSTRFSEEMEQASFSELHNSMVDGVIVCGTQLALEQRSALARANHIIFVNERRLDVGGSLVLDDTVGYVDALQRLGATSRSMYAFLSGPENRPTSRFRLECFQRALETLGAGDRPLPTMFAPQIGLDLEPEIVARVAEIAQRSDVLFCFNDVLAIGVMRGLQERGIRIPEDVGVVGFDGIEMGRVVSPALSTVHVPRFELGRRAMKLLTMMIENGETEPKETVVPYFVARSSHKRTEA